MAPQIGQLIRTARQRRGLTHRDLAQQMGVSHVSIVQWEANRNLPSIPMRLALSRALGIQLIQLLPEFADTDRSKICTDPNELAVLDILRQMPQPQREVALATLASFLRAMALDTAPPPAPQPQPA